MKGIKKSGICRPLLLAFLLILMSYYNGHSQEIAPYFFGQNSWMPDSTGTRFLNGKVHQTWGLIAESGAQSIRFGGISSDRDKPTNHQYLRMIDSIRTNGMEPIIQVSYWKGRYSAQEAGELVKFLNVTHKRNIKYWSIGNEPDHKGSYGYTNARDVAPYIRSFSEAMKDEDPDIVIIGPDCAWYNKNILYELLNPNGQHDVSGKSPKGNYYIDIISFHEYPFSGSQSRSEVISNLKSKNRLDDKLSDLQNRLDKCNKKHGRSGDNVLKMALTEANVNYRNPGNDNLNNTGAMSFIGGQFWAEMLGIGMKHRLEFFNFWSVIEGNNTQLNIGYLNNRSLAKQPSYHHFKMVADNFSGTYCDGKSNDKNIKTFGSKNNNQIAVIILNQNNSGTNNYKLKLNNTSISGSNTAKLNINADLDIIYSDEIENQSSTLLIFNAAGHLIRKCEYKLNGHADKGLSPECIEIDPPPTAEITATSAVLCDYGSIILTASEKKGNSYQWNKNEEAIPDAVSKTYTATTEGSYTVTIKNGNASTTSEPLEIISGSAPEAFINHDGDLNICNAANVKLMASTGEAYEYIWKLDDVDIPSSNEPDYIATIPGNYTVAISSPCGDDISEPVIIAGCDAVTNSILNEEDDDNIIHAYPNPTTGYFTVEMKTAEIINGELANMEILNSAGQVVHKQVPNQLNGYIREVIELDNAYPNGVYIIRISTGVKTYMHKVTVVR